MRSRHPEFRSVAECHESQGGRRQSGDTLPYSPAREVDDIAALIKAAGGSAFLVGLSSGVRWRSKPRPAVFPSTARWRTNRPTWMTMAKLAEPRMRET